MWFKHKAKNRRLGREFVLDVKLRSSQIRAARVRTLCLSLGAVFGILLGGYLLWRAGEWSLNQLVYENKAFAIEELDIQTDGAIAADQLRRWSGVRLGQNLFRLDLAKVRRDLLLVSRIQSASIERVLPHTLRIRVIEREPLAQLALPRPRPDGRIELATLQLDAEGYVIVPMDTQQRAVSSTQSLDELPVIFGLNANEAQAGRRVESPQVRAALGLLVAFEHSPMETLADLKRIDVSAPEVLVATTGQGSLITFGLTDFDQQLRRWQEIFQFGQKLSRAIATLDLAVTNNIPASWLEASTVPATTPKPPKSLRSKKKHV
jgi:cell division septal protein FtsQ